jgi:dipeptidase E
MARLVLYSDQIIEANEKVDKELLKLFNKNNPSIAYIPSASDVSRKYYNQKVEYYRSLGITNLQYFDLDMEYDETQIRDILNCDAIHLSGGNTFYFLHTLRKRGFIELLKTYVENGGVLIGISAGSILTTKTVAIAGIGEDSDENIIGIVDFNALGIADFEFAPHFNGSEEYLELLREYAKSENTTVYACKDGDGIIVDGKDVKLIGDVIKINS